jgi:hypothetical protein
MSCLTSTNNGLIYFHLVSRDLTLVVCVWEAPPVELHSSPSSHMAVFDINRWYHSQMPASIRYVL